MCGIAGIVTQDTAEPPHQMLRTMRDALSHRGPDDAGEYYGRGVALGFRRLSIIDLSAAGHQPMTNENETLWLVFNGEIYNYETIRAELKRRGHVFRSQTDSETIVHAYEEYGPQCLEHFRGMFAFAIWDTRTRTLFAARDRLGKKPFVYTIQNGAFLFASEIQSLLTVVPKPSINTSVFPFYFRTQCIPSPHTVYKGIAKLPPAHYLEWKDGKIRTTRYWSPRFTPKTTLSFDEAGEAFERIFRESIRLRLRSDVPLGVFLSGGLDSSLITAIAAKEQTQQLQTFSIGFEEQSHNELPLAKLVAERYSTNHHEFMLHPSVASLLPRLLQNVGEPFADSSIIATYAVAEKTRPFVTVALNGDGGDENFAGYEKYDILATLAKFDILPMGIRRLLAFIARRIATVSPGMLRKKIPLGSDLLEGDLVSRYLDLFFLFRPREEQLLFTPDVVQVTEDDAALEMRQRLAHFSGQMGSDIDRVTALDLAYYLPECLLVKADISSMANSLETRSPFLDHTVIEFTATLPPEYKRHGAIKKYLLRQRFGSLLPPQLLHAPKHGFDLPVNTWLRGPLASYLSERLYDASLRSLPWFNWTYVERLIDEHQRGLGNHGIKLWSLLCFAVWYEDVYCRLP